MAIEFDEKEGKGVAEIRDFALDPIYCIYLQGYFEITTRLAMGKANAVVTETECVFEGDRCHRYLLRW